jgi:tetraacyldisaccharide 4'-kinase
LSARRGWGRPLVPVYAAGLRLREALRGEPKRLRWPVVSVGSLSAGGAGKTPVVIALAELLKDAGWGVDVLSRGYGRDGRGVERVVVPGEQPVPEGDDSQKSKGKNQDVSGDRSAARFGDGPAARFGDEPVLIARRAGVAVWVGANRLAAGCEAEETLGAALNAGSSAALRNDKKWGQNGKQIHLLDDGFQHRQLARDVDIVLVTAEDLDDALIPAGNLREPLGALGRADVVVVREDEVEGVAKRVWPLLREGARMWVVRRGLRFPAPLFVFGAGLRPVAFCGLARPEGFAAMLAEAGCGVVETVAFQDHHRYTMGDIERVIGVANGLDATGLVTTEKDAVKLSAAMRGRLEEVGALMVVALEAEFDDRGAVVLLIERAVARREQQIPGGDDRKKSKGGLL